MTKSRYSSLVTANQSLALRFITTPSNMSILDPDLPRAFSAFQLRSLPMIPPLATIEIKSRGFELSLRMAVLITGVSPDFFHTTQQRIQLPSTRNASPHGPKIDRLLCFEPRGGSEYISSVLPSLSSSAPINLFFIYILNSHLIEFTCSPQSTLNIFHLNHCSYIVRRFQIRILDSTVY